MIRGLSPGPMLPPARQPNPQDDAMSRRKKIAQALMQPASKMMSPQQFSFAVGRNFSDMYSAPQPMSGAAMRPMKGMR
jgi:hypothetical protein